jgi:hypothetical protein
MEVLLVAIGIGFAGGFSIAWLFTGSIRKEIANLAGKIDGFLVAVKKL